GGRVVQRHVLYNDSQELAWRRSIEVLEDGETRPRTLSLLPGDRCDGLLADASIVRVKLAGLRLSRPRQWGACWLALMLWRELELDVFWSKRLGVSRKGRSPSPCRSTRVPPLSKTSISVSRVSTRVSSPTAWLQRSANIFVQPRPEEVASWLPVT